MAIYIDIELTEVEIKKYKRQIKYLHMKTVEKGYKVLQIKERIINIYNKNGDCETFLFDDRKEMFNFLMVEYLFEFKNIVLSNLANE